MPAKRPEIDGIPLPDPAAIERQRRREQPAHREERIQPSIHDIQEEGYRRWREEQDRNKKPEDSGRGVFIIDMGGGDEDE